MFVIYSIFYKALAAATRLQSPFLLPILNPLSSLLLFFSRQNPIHHPNSPLPTNDPPPSLLLFHSSVICAPASPPTKATTHAVHNCKATPKLPPPSSLKGAANRLLRGQGGGKYCWTNSKILPSTLLKKRKISQRIRKQPAWRRDFKKHGKAKKRTRDVRWKRWMEPEKKEGGGKGTNLNS